MRDKCRATVTASAVAVVLGCVAAVQAHGPPESDVDTNILINTKPEARALLHDQDMRPVAEVRLHSLPHGTLVHASLFFLPPGMHAFHIHETGKCEPPFTSAGGHYNPDGHAHGLTAEEGFHAGDMPNLHVVPSQRMEVEVHNSRVTVRQLLESPDGTAIVIHEGPDDYSTDPAGAAGPRIACGVIEAN